MFRTLRTNYNHTIYACYLGYITQAIVNNLAPLLFLTFQNEFFLSLEQITLLTTLNFLVQLLTDLAAARFVDRIGYRPCLMAAHVFSALGLAGMALLPGLLPKPYVGLLAAVVLYAFGGGLLEVLISPVVEACPTEKKEATMSLLHSFYCWGHVGVVLLSTLFFQLAGIENWRILPCLWALIPLVNLFYFSQVPIYPIVAENEGMSLRQLMGQRLFWLLMVLMVCAGASEHSMVQWSSAFAEAGLGVSKTVGDLAGPCSFAILMGIARTIYGKYSDHMPLRTMMMGSAVLCVFCYLLASLSANPVLALMGCAFCGFSVGLFWPGTFSMAAKQLPGGGTAMFALMALAGDLGCGAGPTLVGFGAELMNGSLHKGLLFAILFPVVMLLGVGVLKKK